MGKHPENIVDGFARRKGPDEVRIDQDEVRARRGAAKVLAANTSTESPKLVLRPQFVQTFSIVFPRTHELLFALPSWR
jgi:hypothetical protein